MWGWWPFPITHVAPDILRFSQSLVQVNQALACRVQVYQIDQRVGRVSVVRAHNDVVLPSNTTTPQWKPEIWTRWDWK